MSARDLSPSGACHTRASTGKDSQQDVHARRSDGDARATSSSTDVADDTDDVPIRLVLLAASVHRGHLVGQRKPCGCLNAYLLLGSRPDAAMGAHLSTSKRSRRPSTARDKGFVGAALPARRRIRLLPDQPDAAVRRLERLRNSGARPDKATPSRWTTFCACRRAGHSIREHQSVRPARESAELSVLPGGHGLRSRSVGQVGGGVLNVLEGRPAADAQPYRGERLILGQSHGGQDR